MFGKRSNSTNDFVMMMGRKAGNLPAERAKAGRPASKSITAAKAGAGKKEKPNAVPPVPKAQMVSGNGAKPKTLSMTSSRGLSVNKNRPNSTGKANTWKVD